jgi:hypothetical protein
MMKEKISENLGELASAVELDHEVQLARSELYKLAKYAIKLHNMLKNASEEQGLEGWVSAEITKASEGISKVFHSLEYEMKVGKGSDEDLGKMGPDAMPFESKSHPYKNKLAEKLKSKVDQDVEEAHPNDSMYDKCWDGYEKVPGKKRGEKGSCRKKS